MKTEALHCAPPGHGQEPSPRDEGEQRLQRKGSAIWSGDLKSGKGTVSADSGVLKATQYSFSTRFENGIGTNPEELIAAAHAGCFSMALSGQLGEAEADANEHQHDGHRHPREDRRRLHRDQRSTSTSSPRCPAPTRRVFDKAADDAKAGCPISRLLKAEITMTARLEA